VSTSWGQLERVAGAERAAFEAAETGAQVRAAAPEHLRHVNAALKRDVRSEPAARRPNHDLNACRDIVRGPQLHFAAIYQQRRVSARHTHASGGSRRQFDPTERGLDQRCAFSVSG
jgi:hypothetical protein